VTDGFGAVARPIDDCVCWLTYFENTTWANLPGGVWRMSTSLGRALCNFVEANGRSYEPEPVKGSGLNLWDWRPTLLFGLVTWTAA
jgi:hypothetical protein